MATKKTRVVSSDQKSAMAQGRSEGAIVRRYLTALENNRPKRGRKRTAESVTRQLAAVEEQLGAADPIQRLSLIQRRMDLASELERMDDKVDLTELETDFIAVAAGYGQRKGITYAAWREIGVSAAVLRSAGVNRTRG